ncbi:MAG: hypothetical protein IJ838_05795 [Paludibacteraceae bacterium]|nr:hypothetical protein [Paludibacteraceae bacterium]
MDKNDGIMTWYRQLQSPTDDDRADLEVMLMDRDDPSDAMSAIMGLISNLLQNGFREGVYCLLLVGAQKDNALPVKAQSMGAAIFIAVVYDDAIRQSNVAQEALLDVLAEQHDEALWALRRYSQLRKHMIVMGGRQKDIRQTLIYHLIVVGEEAHELFE